MLVEKNGDRAPDRDLAVAMFTTDAKVGSTGRIFVVDVSGLWNLIVHQKRHPLLTRPSPYRRAQRVVQSASVAFHPTVIRTGDNKLDRELTRRTDRSDGDELKMDEVMQDAE